MENKPAVLVVCTCYNHEPYIRQCLEGFAAQKTDFDFVVSVIDDASTDRSADIIREYEARYPRIIKATYLAENHYQQKKSKSTYYMPLLEQAEFLAVCEGDDYWTDPLKLQKQVDFMRQNADYAVCYCDARVYDHARGRFIDDPIRRVPASATILDLCEGNFIRTPSVLYRNIPGVQEQIEHIVGVMGGVTILDYLYHLMYASHGKIMRLDGAMVVWRLSQTSVWSPLQPYQRGFLSLEALYRITPFFPDEVKSALSRRFSADLAVVRRNYESLLSSPSYRLGRLLAAPARLARRLVGRGRA